MASYNPAAYAPGQPNNPGADGYGRPRTYSHPPPTQPDPNLLGPQQQPYASPALAPYPVSAPFPQAEAFRPEQYGPPPHPAEAYAQPQYPPLMERRADGYDPREDYNRRPSHSSQRSAHSHHSRRSHESRLSHESRRSHRSHHSADEGHHHHQRHHHDDDEPSEDHRHHHRHSSDDVPSDLRDGEHHRSGAGKSSKKQKEHRPTVGDSMWSVLSVLKSALGPRDKY